MGALVRVVGHFGTQFSFASVAGHVTRMLRHQGLLGYVQNMDASWHESFSDLEHHPEQPCTHVLLFTSPNEYYGAFAEWFGKERSAIYTSPNTATLSDEHARLMSQFGLVIAPSEYCANTVRRHVPSTEVVTLPLGVDTEYAQDRNTRLAGLWGRINKAPTHKRPTFVHLSTDQSWPGRKGTEELIEAWEQATRLGCSGHLVIHVPAAIYGMVEMAARDIGRHRTDFLERVEVRKPSSKGSGVKDLVSLYDEADMMVLPSRCEGYGLMIHAALVAGVPLLTTYGTGQVDFLDEHPGAWIGLPTWHHERLAYEEGTAPVVDLNVLATYMRVSAVPDTRRVMLEHMDFDVSNELWPTALERWALELRKWMEE